MKKVNEDNQVRIMEWEEEVQMYQELIASGTLSGEEILAANFAIGFGLGQIQILKGEN